MSTVYGVDHIGIAVSDIEKAVRVYEAILGKKADGIEKIPGRSVCVTFFKVGDTKIELIAPLEEGKGTTADFIAKRGQGLHHICLAVKDIKADLSEFKSKGMRLIDETPRPGAHGRSVAFLHPSAAEGVLLELIQCLS